MSVTLYQKVMNTAGENRWRQSGKWFWWFEPFSKLKAAFYEYWTLLKIKISMTCLTKEYEIKTKYWVITWKPLFGGGRSIFGWGWLFQGKLEGMSKFLAGGGDSSHLLSRENPICLQSYLLIYRQNFLLLHFFYYYIKKLLIIE